MSDAVKVETPYLVEGMYVSELDIPWENSGFVLQGFLVTDKHIKVLREKCEWVIVLKSHSNPGIFKEKIHRKVSADDVEAEEDGDYESFLVYFLRVLKLDVVFNAVIGFFSTSSSSAPRQVKASKKSSPKIAGNKEEKSAPKSDDLSEGVFTKQDAVFQARAVRARGGFVDDELVTLEVVKHMPTKNLNEEFETAQEAKKKLNAVLENSLLSDAMNSDSMNIVLNETKESVGDIVESMLRNPDAMRLVDDIRTYDNLSYKHAVDVCILMIAFGRELQLPKEALVELGIGGLLHDTGEVKPLGDKPVRVRNIAMYKIYQSHVVDGIERIKNAGYSDIVKAIVAEHHERYDGSGYPNGLCNEPSKVKANANAADRKPKISMYGLMIGIVDTYVSMVSGRNCKNPIAPSVAMVYITRRAGKDFDPILCDVFSQVIGVYPVGVHVELNTGEIAIVVKQNRVWRLKPTVQIIMDAERKKIEPLTVDLINASSGRSITKEVLLEVPSVSGATI